MMMEYLAMGGHAGFIWPSYGVVAVVMIGLFIASHRALGTAQRELDSLAPPDDNEDAQ